MRQPPRLMVVDDEPAITDTIGMILKQYGYDCTLAYDGYQAVERARQVRPQFILMGVMMPRMLGTEAARIILDEMPDCKIVLFSGSRYAGGHVDVLQSAGYEVDILSKPLHPDDLIAKLREFGFEPPQKPPWPRKQPGPRC